MACRFRSVRRILVGAGMLAALVRPLAGVQVSVPRLGVGTLTNSSGEFMILNVAPGAHTVSG